MSPQGRRFDQALAGELAGRAADPGGRALRGIRRADSRRPGGRGDRAWATSCSPAARSPPWRWSTRWCACCPDAGRGRERHGGVVQHGLLEYPQYTRPREFRGMAVPEVLLSGDHARIAAWRDEQAVERTQRRPDLWETYCRRKSRTPPKTGRTGQENRRESGTDEEGGRRVVQGNPPQLPHRRHGERVRPDRRGREGTHAGLQRHGHRQRGGGIGENFTVRRIVNNEGVERTFPLHSPHLVEVQVVRAGRIRRAKLYYLRDRVGKSIRLRDTTRVATEATDQGHRGRGVSRRVAVRGARLRGGRGERLAAGSLRRLG